MLLGRIGAGRGRVPGARPGAAPVPRSLHTTVRDAVPPTGLGSSGRAGAVTPYPEHPVVLLGLEPLDDDASRVYWTLRVDDGGEDSDVPRDGDTTGPGVEPARGP
ncbi:hypothetical protein AB0O01_30340 [Streptomyces sp. NPDC093252]|uniref:hypothetical protein n=1 Tax=Streptomyces sp. NPDC093252 TaxID=3154980 RepID=UPI003421A719